MMFDSQHDAGTASRATSFEPMARSSAAAKKSLRGRAGALLTTTALVTAASAMVALEAGAQVGVPTGFAPAPADVVSYVQLSNGSVLVQLANQQSLLVTSNNFFIDGSGVLYLSPTVSTGISGGDVSSGAMIGGAPAPMSFPEPMPMGTTNVGSTSSGVIFDDTTAASSSGGILGTITGGPGLFGLGTLGTVAAVGLGAGALVLVANAVRSRLTNDDGGSENSAARLDIVDNEIAKGETGALTYAISDEDGIDESDLVAAVEAAVGGAATIASVFTDGAAVTTERSGSGLIEGTEDSYRSINVTIEGLVADGLNTGEFDGPAMTFSDVAGNVETVNLALNITDGGGNQTGALELNETDGATFSIAQGGSKLFRATDPEGDTISYQISNNPSGIGIDSNTGLVVVSGSVAVGSYSITVQASSTNADGTVENDTETYNINVTAGSGGAGGGNSVNADFDSEGAGFSTLTGVRITDSDLTSNADDEFEVPEAAHLANSFVMDGLGGDDTVYFSEANATYHLDPTWVNGFEDVSGFETLVLMEDVDLELNGGVLDSTASGDVEHLKGEGNNDVTLVNANADLGLDVTVTNIASIDMNNRDLTIDFADLNGIDKVMGDTHSALVFTGQFTYDFAAGDLVTQAVSRIGLDGGNYSYSLTLDGVNDEDVREIVAYGSLEIEGDVMIDTRENPKVELIDMAGDSFTTPGLDGDSNIFATYDDMLRIRGGDNDDDVDLILDSDIEDGEFKFDGGGDDEDSLNINLNGDEIDTIGFGRDIDHVEYIDIDAPGGDGEAHLQFNGSGADKSTLRAVDLSDLSEDGSIVLRGDLSVSNPGVSIGIDQTSSMAPFSAAAPSATSGVRLIDGFVSDDDLEIQMTPGDDVVDLVIGESEYTVSRTAATAGLTMLQVLSSNAPITGVSVLPSTNLAQAAEEVDVHLGGGDDTVDLVIGAAQVDDVTLHIARANYDDHDTVSIDELEDLGALASANVAVSPVTVANVASFGQATGININFEDDVTTILSDASAVDANGVNIAGSTQGALIVFGMNAGAVQRGFIYDYDGDGELSDGDTLIDMTDSLMPAGAMNFAGAPITAAQVISANSSSIGLITDGLDYVQFNLSEGDLVA
ncbi:hypothetical protein N9O95_00405 [Alphaproteobacteria bacterium]|nr:hypothetical protein [Alphaproteobacteria bacterium]